MAFREQQYLDRNFDYICRMLDLLGQNVLEPNYRPNWRTAYITSIVVIVMSELVYLLWTERSDLFAFLQVLPTLLFSCIGVQNVLVCALRSEKVLALRTKLTEILKIMAETEGNGPILCKGLQLSKFFAKVFDGSLCVSGSRRYNCATYYMGSVGQKDSLVYAFCSKGRPKYCRGIRRNLSVPGLHTVGSWYNVHGPRMYVYCIHHALRSIRKRILQRDQRAELDVGGPSGK